MQHSAYREHLKKHFVCLPQNSQFWESLRTHSKEFSIIANLNLDPAIELLESLYSPVKRAPPRDPVCMLRSLILMTLLKIQGITEWVTRMRALSLAAILAGFEPDDTPGIGTYYDFMKRIINGPYRKSCEHVRRRSTFNAGKHQRNLQREKEAHKGPQDPHHCQSETLVAELLPRADEPRPDEFPKILEDLLVRVGILPSIEQGLLNDLHHLIVTGDGSILQTAASPHGQPTCSCRSQGIYHCSHDRYYTSPTAKWCYDAHQDRYVFGDRYYHLVTHQNGHDFPLITLMPGGNESDYTLSLKAFDRFVKATHEQDLNLHIRIFCGDGHHDSYAHYHYFQQKNVSPVIPLSENSKNVFPHLIADKNIRLDTDGTPLCPAGMRMRHHQYNPRKRVHVFTCPVKRTSHRNGKSVYLTHLKECPRKQDCAPHSSLAPLVYIKSDTDPRLYPPIPRDSKRFKEIMNQRSAAERCNAVNDTYHLDRACRNADYGLIRLTLANIVEHAVIRYMESVKTSSQEKLLTQTLKGISGVVPQEFFDTG